MKRQHLFAGGLAIAGLVIASLIGNAAAQAPVRQMAAMANPPSTKNPFAGNAAAVEEGRLTYNSTCTTCHGMNGGAGEFAPGLSMAGRAYRARTDEQIFNTIKNGVQGTAMPPFPQLGDDMTWKITAYIYGLRGTAIDAPTAGDVVNGEKVFFGKGQCQTCHMVKGRGSVIGPDLTNVANTEKTLTIVETLTKDDNRVLPPGGYQSYQLVPKDTYPVVNITMPDGKNVRGVVRNEDSYSMQVMGLDEKLYLLDRTKLKAVVYEEKRLMPADYDKRLTKKEFDDLLAYVTRLGTPKAGAN